MATQIQLLDQLLGMQPEFLKPVLIQVPTMLKSSGTAFDNHASENDNIFTQVQAQLTAQAARASELEQWTDRATKDGTEIKAKVDNLEGRGNQVANDGTAAVNKVKEQEQHIQLIHDAVNSLSQS